MQTQLSDWLSILPPLYLVGVALVVAGWETFLPRDARRSGPVILSLAAVGFALVTAGYRLGSDADPIHGFGNAVILDDLGGFLAVAILVATGLTILLSPPALRRQDLNHGEYYALVLIAAAGMILLVQSTDLVSIFLSVELLSLCLYILAGFFRKDPRSNEAALKYFVTGAFATGFLLYGMALIYGATGELSLQGIANNLRGGPGPLASLGVILLGIGLSFKVGSVPFHMWVPDVYEGAPTPVTAFMSVTVKAAAFGAFVRLAAVLVLAPAQDAVLTGFISVVAIATMVVGNLMALRQDNVKRLLAWSSVAHAGYALAGIAAMGHDVKLGASTVFYVFVYTFMTFGAFAFVIHAGKGRDAENMDDYRGLGKRRPWSAAALTLFLVSLAGLPPTAGFFGKFELFKAAVSADLYAVAIVGMLTSAVSLYYYLRIPVLMYMNAGPEETGTEESGGAGWVVAFAAVVTLVIGFLPSLPIRLSVESLKHLKDLGIH